MERLLVWVVAVLLVSSTAPMIIPQGGRGDPAPGRSPGPPHSRSFVTDVTASEGIPAGPEVTTEAVASWCDAMTTSTTLSSATTALFQFSLAHEKFSVVPGLVAGIYYQVAIKLTTSNKEGIKEVFVMSDRGEWMGETYIHMCSNVSAATAAGAVKVLTERTPLSWRLPQPPLTPANVTFRVLARTTQGTVLEQFASYSVILDCTILLMFHKGSLSSSELPKARDCAVKFPVDVSAKEPSYRRGLLIHLTRLNVPCLYGGYLELQGLSPPRRLCGKLEELNQRDRTFHFPADSLATLRLMRQPIFSLNFTSVDFCYNVTLTSRNGTVSLTPTDTLFCHFRIHLPYGNRVRLLLQVGEEPSTTVTSGEVESSVNVSSTCDGLLVVVWNGASDWSHCSRQITPKPNVEVESLGNVVTVHVMASGADRYPTLRLWYSAVPEPDIVGSCAFGEVAVKKFCVYPVHTQLIWTDAEAHCVTAGGHLLSIRDEHTQFVVDSLLFKSPVFSGLDSYWIGASDVAYEGHYQWSDGYAFSYSNWFPGWQQHGYYNKQPNDDGLSRQDCVEVRRNFPTPSAGGIAVTSTQSYLWNDLDCSTPNFFLCERQRSDDGVEDSMLSECNRTITLSREHPRAAVTSPGFPYHYPDNVLCYTVIRAPPSFHIVLDFEELVLEKEPMCSYDYLEIEDVSETENSVDGRRTHYCGDMSDKLKLLRYASEGSLLNLRFVSDYSNHFGGFKARVSLENARKDCADENQKLFNNFCYLFVGYPKVTWNTAQQICSGMKAHLASVTNREEEDFVTSNLRKSWDYSPSTVFWLGGHVSEAGQWLWADGHPFNFTAWAAHGVDEPVQTTDCLGLQWISSVETDNPGPVNSGLYWSANSCSTRGGYICKKPVSLSPASAQLSKTVNGTEGYLNSPGFPNQYRPDLDYEVRLIGPPGTRIVISLSTFDLESQSECLYDFLDLRSGSAIESEKRWCGSLNPKLHPYNFVSQDNEAFVRFRTDYSVSGSGFQGTWKAVDIAGCPHQTLTAREGILSSPNYSEFVLPLLDCTTTILAGPNKRVWLEFTEIDILDEEGKTLLEVDVGGGRPSIKPLWNNDTIGGGNFVSWGEKLVVHLVTSTKVRGVGFRAIYRSVSSVHEERLIDIASDANGNLHHLNFPSQPARLVDFVQHFVAPLGYIIVLEFYKVIFNENGPSCPGGRGVLEISDNYADVNGTWWFLCPVDELSLLDRGSVAPVAITSYLHTLHVRQRSLSIGLHLNATLRVKEDRQFKLKILKLPDDMSVEACRPNPCLNGGKCIDSAVRNSCHCASHFTGLFCALTQCELKPCLFGVCELTTVGYHCRCQAGYTGRACEQKQRPCADNPCEGRGECMERGDAFHCQCHAWWEGPRCERKMIHIPYKPLTERMLHEPFWLGLITVFVVLGVIGLFWCAKRHFPEKLEKLLAEEADRNGRLHGQGASRPPSGRDLAGGSASAQLHSPTAAAPRTLLSRLGIRKPSLLSLSSPVPVPIAAPRTFSLDDLLRSSPRRSPTLRKKRTNSTPTTKKNVVEKKQILQQLISPSTGAPSTSKDKLNQFIQLTERRGAEPVNKSPKTKETSFSAIDSVPEDRLEKKVTFARLMNKVSAEMSSGSEAENMKPPLIRAVSTPVSPATKRVPLSMNQADSLSSSEVTISAGTSTLDIPSMTPKRPNRLNCSGYRNPSADSLLAMLRSLGAQSTAPSPMDDSFCSEESLAIDTPGSSSSGPPDSPSQGISIEVPITDSSSLKSPQNNFLQPPSIHLEIPSGGINKCLSPIREVPTPMSSPALTPIMTRISHESKSKLIQSKESSEEDKIEGEDTDEMTDGYSELVVEIHHQADSPIHDEPPTLIIPTVTVEEPSPKIENKSIPTFTFSGSPPPQKRELYCFQVPRSPTKKMLKQFEKPTSLDLPHPPPMIMVTCNASEGESDTESSKQALTHNQNSSSSGMNYLSPFSMCSRGDRTTSESNLSSSGYSSMASPGPSRCNSNNPLCLSEVEDQSGNSQSSSRRPSPLLRTPNTDAERHYRRRRSDSETMSDDPLVESNDEGIGTDHPEEKIDDSELPKEEIHFLDLTAIPIPPPRNSKKCDNIETLCPPLCKTSLQLPTIVVQSDFCDKMLSPVSSRSESPLSDKTLGLGRFSPMFYCKNKSDQLPFTDSDGLYDFPSSDCPPSKHKCVQGNAAPQRKRRDRRASASRPSASASAPGNKSPSPTKGVDAPTRSPRKPSPKRRMRTQAPPSSSSSTESLTFGKGNVSIRLTSPDGTEWPVRKAKQCKGSLILSNEASGEDTTEEISGGMDSSPEEISRPQRNLSRLRSIAHQIRFLRRIECSLRRKDRARSQSDSGDDDDDEGANSATRSLLPKTVKTTILPSMEMRKSSSNSLLASSRRRTPRGSSHLTRQYSSVSVSLSHGLTD